MRVNINTTLLLFLFIVFSFSVVAQKKSKAALEKEKQELVKKIEDAGKILNETQSSKKTTESQLIAINQKINAQTRYIQSLDKELKYMSEESSELTDIIFALQRDVDSLKSEYSRMIYSASKINNDYNELIFLFTSSSYNELMMRLKYLIQFTEARKKQVQAINRVQASLLSKKTQLNNLLDEKKMALSNLKSEKEKLDGLKVDQKKMLVELSGREDEFRKKITQWRSEQEKLEKLIKDIIAEEIAKAKAAEKKSSKETNLLERKETALISKNFEANKSRLPWPVARCIVARKFGRQAHAVLERVYVDNMGIGLQTEKNATVKAVFGGVVTTVANIPGMHRIVMIKHGDYFTVYARLSEVNVKTGQTIEARQEIGKVYSGHEGETELEFQIWHGKEKLNPEEWLSK